MDANWEERNRVYAWRNERRFALQGPASYSADPYIVVREEGDFPASAATGIAGPAMAAELWGQANWAGGVAFRWMRASPGKSAWPLFAGRRHSVSSRGPRPWRLLDTVLATRSAGSSAYFGSAPCFDGCPASALHRPRLLFEILQACFDLRKKPPNAIQVEGFGISSPNGLVKSSQMVNYSPTEYLFLLQSHGRLRARHDVKSDSHTSVVSIFRSPGGTILGDRSKVAMAFCRLRPSSET